MEFQEALTIMNYFMNESSEVGYIFAGRKSDTDKSIRFMLKDIDDLSKNKPYDTNQQNLGILKQSVLVIKNVVSDSVITKDFSNFVDAYLLLTSNWNNATFKDADLQSDIKLILRYKDLHFTSAELINQGKDLVKRFKNLSNFALPSIELSKHYLARFKEKVVENNGMENRNNIHAVNINNANSNVVPKSAPKSDALIIDVLSEKLDLSKKSSGSNVQESTSVAPVEFVKSAATPVAQTNSSINKLNFNKKL